MNNNMIRNGRASMLAPLVLVALLAALGLAACGSEAPAEDSQTQTQADETGAQTEPATEVPPTEVPPTEVPPTEVPPTEPPPPEEASEEAPATEAPEPTTEPDDATLAMPSGLCAHPFYPVGEGVTYTYNSETAGFGTSEISFTYSNVTEDSFDVTLAGTEGDEAGTLTWTWECSEDGLLSPNFLSNLGSMGMTIEVVEASGLTIPAPEDFEPGTTWETRYVLRATISDPTVGDMSMDQILDITNEIVGVETVSVPAGDFEDALRIATTVNMQMIAYLDSEPLPATEIQTSGVSWYVENVGRVRSEDTVNTLGTGPIETITELISITTP